MTSGLKMAASSQHFPSLHGRHPETRKINSTNSFEIPLPMVKLGDKQNSISQNRSRDFPKWEKNEGGRKEWEKQVADEGHSPENWYHGVEENYN